jgi:hypothetical protein
LESRARRQRRHPLFGQSSAQADLGYWAKVARWDPDEAAALSLGYAPQYVNTRTIKPYLQTSPDADEFDRRLILIVRALDVGLLKRQFGPADFITWADRISLELPKALRDAVAAIGASDKTLHDEIDELRKQNERLKIELDQCKAANEEPHPRERRSFQIIVAGMAWSRYGFNPSAERNSATKAIVDDIALLGRSIDKDTVLTHLRGAFRDLGIKLDT